MHTPVGFRGETRTTVVRLSLASQQRSMCNFGSHQKPAADARVIAELRALWLRETSVAYANLSPDFRARVRLDLFPVSEPQVCELR
jgi:hypothetical protein